MSYERKRLQKVCVAMLAIVIVAGGSVAVAQRKSPGGLTGGQRVRPGTWANQRASRSIQHARDYSRDIYRYSRDASRIDPVIAKAESEELGRNIEMAQQGLATAQQQAGDHESTVNAIKSIESHLAKAASRHKQLHEECCQDAVDGVVSMKCCSDITLHLDRAMAEHAALIRLLEIGDERSEEETAVRNEHGGHDHD